MFTSDITRRRFLQASSAALAGIAAGANLSSSSQGEAASNSHNLAGAQWPCGERLGAE